MASGKKSAGIQLRTECLAIVDSLDIPVPFHLQAFCDRLQERRGRPLSLRPVALPPGSPSGVCVSTQATDYIFFEVSTSSLHQEHIVLHEIGHLLWGHQTAMTGSEQVLQLLLPSLDPRVVMSMLGRGDCTGITEQQAELVATLIMQRAVRRLPSPARPALGEDAETITRLSRTLEDPEDLHG
jgi:hypothetical protein